MGSGLAIQHSMKFHSYNGQFADQVKESRMFADLQPMTQEMQAAVMIHTRNS